MSRLLYAALLRLHPRVFRERFGEEMIDIFDEEVRNRAPVALLFEALVSVFRQWMLRPAYPAAALSTASPSHPPDAPMFHMFGNNLPRRTALLNGAVLSIIVLSGISFAIGRGGSNRALLIGAKYPRSGLVPVDRSSIVESEPTTEIKVKSPEVDPLYQLADVYFKIVRVLDVLDANRDRTISTWEMVTAASPLARLDTNHDGLLSAEECGFFLQYGPGSKPDPQFIEGAKLDFMRVQPVLATLDSDRDGRVSGGEIKNASARLRTLDRNRDGSLTPVEVLPEPVDARTVMLLSKLDSNRDRKLSLQERTTEKAEPLRETLDRADRDGDGVVTAAELRKELQLHDELKKQLDRAMRSSGVANSHR